MAALLYIVSCGTAYSLTLNEFIDRTQSVIDKVDASIVYTPTECFDSKTPMLAFCASSENIFGFCLNRLNDLGEIAKVKTVAHEAVHMAQDCKAGINNPIIQSLMSSDEHREMVSKMEDRTLFLIEDTYERREWVWELEAFFFEDHPEHVLTLIEYYC